MYRDVYNAISPGLSDGPTREAAAYRVYWLDNKLVLAIQGSGTRRLTVNLYDIYGKAVLKTSWLTSAGQEKVYIPAADPGKGVYLYRIQTVRRDRVGKITRFNTY